MTFSLLCVGFRYHVTQRLLCCVMSICDLACDTHLPRDTVFPKNLLNKYPGHCLTSQSYEPLKWDEIASNSFEFVSVVRDGHSLSLSSTDSIVFVDLPLRILLDRLPKEKLKTLALNLSLFSFHKDFDRDALLNYIESNATDSTQRTAFQLRSITKRKRDWKNNGTYHNDISPVVFDLDEDIDCISFPPNPITIGRKIDV